MYEIGMMSGKIGISKRILSSFDNCHLILSLVKYSWNLKCCDFFDTKDDDGVVVVVMRQNCVKIFEIP